MLAAVKLRRLWRQLLLMKLTDTSAQVRDEEKHKAEQNALEARLSRGLVEFVHNTTIFSIKRLLPADLKVKALYFNDGCQQVFSSRCSMWEQGEIWKALRQIHLGRIIALRHTLQKAG